MVIFYTSRSYTKSGIWAIKGFSFIIKQSTAALSDRVAASPGMPRDSLCARDTNKINVFYLAE